MLEACFGCNSDEAQVRESLHFFLTIFNSAMIYVVGKRKKNSRN